ncbi:hypothetical protein MPER_02130 [Moniliophthora perniciosa FA553]|nr:hypothetical protein MPER_02130 [Moniliophthora perniciosa FA553]
MGSQTLQAASVLPDSVRLDSAQGSADGSTTGTGNGGSNSSETSKGKLIAVIVGAVVGLALIGALAGICIARRRRAAKLSNSSISYPMNAAAPPVGGYGHAQGYDGRELSSSVFVPYKHDYNSSSASHANLVDHQRQPYDAYADNGVSQYRPNGMSIELDPYSAESRMPTTASSPYGGRPRY